jgi:hypothetical protein
VPGWSEPVDIHLPSLSLLSQTKNYLSLAAVEAILDSATYDVVAKCGAGHQPKLDLLGTHTTLYYRLYGRRWSGPVDLPSLLSQTKYNRSLAAVEANEDSATYDVVKKCGAGRKPKLDLLRTHTTLCNRL